MNYLGSQLWRGKARYLHSREGVLSDSWAPYAQLDFAVKSVGSAPNDEFEKRTARVVMALAERGRPLLLLMLDEAMRSIWRGYERAELLQGAQEIMNTVPASTAFASAEYALVSHVLHTENSGLERESQYLATAVDGGNPFAAGVRALICIREDFTNAFEATLLSAKLGNQFAPLEYVVQYHKLKQLNDSNKNNAYDQLRLILMELAQQDDSVALLDLALASRADQELMLLSASAGNWQALWNVQNDDCFWVSDDVAEACRNLDALKPNLEVIKAKLMQSALLSCWNSCRLGV